MDTGKVPYCGVKEQCRGWDGGCDIDFDSMDRGLESVSSRIPRLSFTVRGLDAGWKEGKLGLVLRSSWG